MRGIAVFVFFAYLIFSMPWFLYLIECADGSLYTGIATDVEARFAKHVSGDGAKYTRSRKPVAVRASFELSGRAEASRAEYWVKRLTVARKWALVRGDLEFAAVMPPVEIEADASTIADPDEAGERIKVEAR
jgi:putative endonuclease